MKILARDLGRGFVVVEFPHERVFGDLADGRFADVRAERSEITAEPDLVVETNFLIAEKNYLVLDERFVHLFNLPVGKRLCQIDAADFGANVRRDWRYCDGFI